MEIELAIEAKETGEVVERRLPLPRRVTLGRGPESPVPLDGNGLSREHIAFQPENGGVHLVDLSVNGTWINGRRLQPGKSQPVTAADRIEIPGYSIRLRVHAPGPAASGAPGPGTPAAAAKPSPLRAALASITPFEGGTVLLALLALALAAVYWQLQAS